MTHEPINNPPIPPSPAAQPIESSPSELGPAMSEAPPFTLPQAPSPPVPEKPNLMDVAKDAANARGWSQEEIEDDMTRLRKQLFTAQNRLQDAGVTRRFSDDHYTALNRLTKKLTPDMRQIATLTGGTFAPEEAPEGTSMLDRILKWIGGAQETMTAALAYASTIKNPQPADMMRLQFAMHRASERGELFASIIGSTVSGIKTIMSAQLG